MFSKLGIFSILAGCFVGLFSMISKFMSTDNIWVGLTLSSLSEDFAQSIVNLVSVQSVQNALDTLFYEIPLGGVLLGLGVFFFVIAIFVKEH